MLIDKRTRTRYRFPDSCSTSWPTRSIPPHGPSLVCTRYVTAPKLSILRLSPETLQPPESGVCVHN